MTYTPPKTVKVTPSTTTPYATCSGCPGVVVYAASAATHKAWHGAVGIDVTSPTAVATLTAVDIGAGAVRVTWTAPSTPAQPVTGYLVGRDGTEAGGGSPNWSGTVSGTTRFEDFSNLAAGTTYKFTVTPQPGGAARSISFTTAPVTPTPTPPVAAPGLVWREEFDTLSLATDSGGGAWRTKGYEAGGTLAVGFQDYAGSNWNASKAEADAHADMNPFSVANSVLTISARRASPEFLTYIRAHGGDANITWTSGYLVSNHLAGDHGSPLTWRYGYFEFRARFTNPARGMFPALWTFNNVSPRSDGHEGAELDLLEIFGSASGMPWCSGIHFNPTALSSGQHSGSHGFNVDTVSTDTTGWHRYGLEWRSDAIIYYKDGVEVGRVTDADALAWYQNANLGLRLNYAVDPSWISPGDPARTTPTDPPIGHVYTMDVDYVRVFNTKPVNLPTGSADPLA